jgi:WD40 repeat protein
VYGVVLLPDRSIISASFDETVRHWSSAGRLLHTVALQSGPFWSLERIAGNTILAGATNGSIVMYSPATRQVRRLEGHAGPVRGLAIAAAQGRFYSASGDRTVREWTDDGKPLRVLRTHRAPVWSIAISPEGDRLASGAGDGRVLLWDLVRDRVTSLGSHAGRVYSVAYSPRGAFVATTSVDGTAHVHDLRTGTTATQRGYDTAFGPIGFTPDDDVIVFGTKAGDIVLRSLHDQRAAHVRAHDGMILSLAFLRNGQLLATAGLDGMLQVWNVQEMLRSTVPRDPVALRRWLASATDLVVDAAGNTEPPTSILAKER